jgi:hypothetical protein
MNMNGETQTPSDRRLQVCAVEQLEAKFNQSDFDFLEGINHGIAHSAFPRTRPFIPNSDDGHSWPTASHMDLMHTYHEAGNFPATTALLIAVGPTPNATPIWALPNFSAISKVVIMKAIYPPLVDQVKTTIGELQTLPPLVDNLSMNDRPDYSEIGERLAGVRKGFSELSQKAWAEKNGFNPTQYNNWERGSRRISVDAAEILADRYGLDLDFIFRGRVSGLSEKALKVL